MPNLQDTEGWAQLGLSLTAVQEGDSWIIQVRRPVHSHGQIQFRVRTRLEHGQLDPYDAFLGLCETLAGLPHDYGTWINLAGLPDTEGYQVRFNELRRQKQSMSQVLGPDLAASVAALRQGGPKRALPTGPRGVSLFPGK